MHKCSMWNYSVLQCLEARINGHLTVPTHRCETESYLSLSWSFLDGSLFQRFNLSNFCIGVSLRCSIWKFMYPHWLRFLLIRQSAVNHFIPTKIFIIRDSLYKFNASFSNKCLLSDLLLLSAFFISVSLPVLGTCLSSDPASHPKSKDFICLRQK